jgi:hypothetical protein
MSIGFKVNFNYFFFGATFAFATALTPVYMGASFYVCNVQFWSREGGHAQKYDPDDDGGRDEEEGGVDHPRRSYASLDDEELHIR